MLFPLEGAPPGRLVTVGSELRWRGLASIWFRPRATIRHVLDDTDYAVGAHWIGVVVGMLFTLGNIPLLASPGAPSWLPILAKVVLLGPLAGLVWLYFNGGLVTIVGRVLGGEGEADQLRAAVAWGGVPVMVALGVALPLMQWFARTFQAEAAAGRGDQPQAAVVGLGVVLALLIVLAGSLWTWVTTTLTVAETHKISAWRAFACVLAAQLVPPLAALLAGQAVGRIAG